MFKSLFVCVFLLVGAVLVIAQEQSKPQLHLKPKKSVVYYPDSVRFVRESIKVINTGGSPMTIKEVKSSCGCATAGVGRAVIHPTSLGYIYLNIDVSRLTDSVMRVDYYIYTNAEDSVVTYPVYLHKKQTQKH